MWICGSWNSCGGGRILDIQLMGALSTEIRESSRHVENCVDVYCMLRHWAKQMKAIGSVTMRNATHNATHNLFTMRFELLLVDQAMIGWLGCCKIRVESYFAVMKRRVDQVSHIQITLQVLPVAVQLSLRVLPTRCCSFRLARALRF